MTTDKSLRDRILAIALFPVYLVLSAIAVVYWIVAALVRGREDEP